MKIDGGLMTTDLRDAARLAAHAERLGYDGLWTAEAGHDPYLPAALAATATERITMVVLNEDGSRDKFTLSSWVGIPRKHELMWIGDDPYMIIEVEYAVSEGFFGARSIDAAGVYVRRLTKDEQEAVARRLANPVRGKDEQPFRP